MKKKTIAITAVLLGLVLTMFLAPYSEAGDRMGTTTPIFVSAVDSPDANYHRRQGGGSNQHGHRNGGHW